MGGAAFIWNEACCQSSNTHRRPSDTAKSQKPERPKPVDSHGLPSQDNQYPLFNSELLPNLPTTFLKDGSIRNLYNDNLPHSEFLSGRGIKYQFILHVPMHRFDEILRNLCFPAPRAVSPLPYLSPSACLVHRAGPNRSCCCTQASIHCTSHSTSACLP